MKNRRRVTAIVLISVVLLCVAAAAVIAVLYNSDSAFYLFPLIIRKGSCGESLTWSFDSDTGVLTISGTGGMTEYMEQNSPWYRSTAIKSVNIENGADCISGYAFQGCTELTSVNIPDSVTSIGMCAFQGCTELTSVNIPDSVTGIFMFAFELCTGLTSVKIPDSVTFIGSFAFESCTGLTSINIPAGVTVIESHALSNCTGMTAINVDENNPVYYSEDGVLFYKEENGIVCYPAGKTDTSYTVPNGVMHIYSSAFLNCTSLTSIIIPDSVESIGTNAFRNTKSVKDVYIYNPDVELSDSEIGYDYDESEYQLSNSISTVIHGKPGSTAEAYAKENELTFVPI